MRLHVVALVLLTGVPAQAAGLFLGPRGVRAMSRGGAFVAGADDVGAMAYNPAGIAEARGEIRLDAAMPFYETTYTRRVFPGGPGLESVEGSPFGLPSPTLGFIHGFGLVDGLQFGVALIADYPALQHWPDALDNGDPSPQRYAVGNYRGTLISKVSAGAAYQIGEWVSLGATFQLMFGTFANELTLSTCDGVICTLPENPDFDARAQMVAEGIVLPGAQVGAIVKPTDWLRIGLAWESGYTIEQAAEINIRLPSAAAYRNAVLDPEVPTGTVSFQLPMHLRGGLEVRPIESLRAEVAFYFEPWSVHDSIHFEPDDIVIRNVAAIGDYAVGALDIPRNNRDTWSLRVGGEYSLPGLPDGHALTLRLGAFYEPSAVDTEGLTAMAVDLDKIMVGGGVAYAWSWLSVEIGYSHLFTVDAAVDDSAVLQINPSRPAFDGRTPIGNGDYSAHANVVGLGVAYRF